MLVDMMAALHAMLAHAREAHYAAQCMLPAAPARMVHC
jgi:hypothetical protein